MVRLCTTKAKQYVVWLLVAEAFVPDGYWAATDML